MNQIVDSNVYRYSSKLTELDRIIFDVYRFPQSHNNKKKNREKDKKKKRRKRKGHVT